MYAVHEGRHYDAEQPGVKKLCKFAYAANRISKILLYYKKTPHPCKGREDLFLPRYHPN